MARDLEALVRAVEAAVQEMAAHDPGFPEWYRKNVGPQRLRAMIRQYAGPVKQTLTWGKTTPGASVGQVLKVDGKWCMVLAAEGARTRRLTELDEDMGLGPEGAYTTTQDVVVRPATAEEVAAEEARRAGVVDARRAARGDVQRDQWVAAHPTVPRWDYGSEELRAITALGLPWAPDRTFRDMGGTFQTAIDPETGVQYARWVMSGSDDYYESVYGPVPSKERIEHAKAAREAAHALRVEAAARDAAARAERKAQEAAAKAAREQAAAPASASSGVYLVIGDTYAHRDELRRLGGRWAPSSKGWVFQDPSAGVIRDLERMRGVRVRVVD